MENELWLPMIDDTRCNLCGDCITACPTDTLALSQNSVVIEDPEACDYCSICEQICPTEAIALPYELSLGSSL